MQNISCINNIYTNVLKYLLKDIGTYLTHGLARLHPALGVGAAGVGIARVLGAGRHHGLGRGRHAAGEGVALGAGRAAAHRAVGAHLAHRRHAAGPRARVDTLLGDAGEAGAAVAVLQTLGPAASRGHGVALVTSPAGADDLTHVILAALGVGAAGAGLARVLGHAAVERVASEARVAAAVLARVGDQTLGVVPAGPGLAEAQHGGGHGHAALDGVDGLGEARPAGAPLHVVHHHALRVGAARVGFARLGGADTRDGGRVALVAGQAVAHRPVSDHPAPGVGAALVTTALGTI